MQVELGDQTITDKDNMILVHGFVIRASTRRKPNGKEPVHVTIKSGSVWICDNRTGRTLEIPLPT